MSPSKSFNTSGPVSVMGAGFSGLLSAYYLSEQGYKVDIYESSSTVGGKIQTLKTEFGLRETAANAFIADLEVETVCEKIGVPLLTKNKEAQRRWIYRARKLRQWPMSFHGSLSIAKFIISLSLHKKKMSPASRENLKTWSDRVLGAEVTQFLLSPACMGIFGVEAEALSASLIFDYFFPSKKPPRGELRGSVAPAGGMQEFALKMREYLEKQGVKFHLNTFAKPKSGPTVVALDISSAVEYLKAAGDSRAESLASVPTVDLFSVNVFYEKSLPRQQPGFGVLFPRGEGVEPLGVLLNSFIFPRKESGKSFSETWIFGARNPSIFSEWSAQDFLKRLIQAREWVWGKGPQPQDIFINPWPKALPLYGVELEKVLEQLPLEQNGIYLVGNYLGEIGLNRLFHRAKKMSMEFKPAL